MANFKDLNLLSIGNTIQLAGAIWAGEGKTFLCLFPGEGVPAIIDTLEMSLDEWEQFLRQADIMEVEVLAETPDGLGKAIIRKSARQIAQHVSWAVYKRDGYKCRYCGRDDVPLTVDHLVLWEEGGPSTEANLVSACKKCNKTRGNTQYADWLDHPYYRQMSRNLSATVRQDNLDLLPKLGAIPRLIHKQAKRK